MNYGSFLKLPPELSIKLDLNHGFTFRRAYSSIYCVHLLIT